MSMQAGVFYFDGRAIDETEQRAVLRAARHSACDPPTGRNLPGVFLAHGDFPLNVHTPEPAPPLLARPGAITFDGRLDNREELMLRLGEAHSDASSSAALALAVYAQWGIEGLVHLIGDWSLAIWDTSERALILASDFAGTRPLYYSIERDRLRWSTSLAALAPAADTPVLDDAYVAGLLTMAAHPGRTPYSSIFSVPPGQAVRVAQSQIKAQRFWTPPVEETIRYRSESEYEEQLFSLFGDAVRARLHTTAPVLAELSGGLDSSSAVSMASQLMRRGEVEATQLRTISFEHKGSLDTCFYREMEEFCGFENIHVSTAQYPFLTEAFTGGAQPAFWQSLQTRAAEVARQTGARTYCTGRLGDLVMGNWVDDRDQVAGLLRCGRPGAACKEALAWSQSLRIPIYGVLWDAFLSSLPPSLVRARHYQAAETPHAERNTEDSIAAGFRRRARRTNGLVSREWMRARPERRRHWRALLEQLELRKLQAPEPLEHLCFTHPYAHRPLVAFMMSIPAGLACRPGEPRRLMRRAFRELWPPALQHRRSKDGFGGVFLDSLRPLARILLQERRLQVVERGYVEDASLRRRLQLLSHSLECNEGQLKQIMLLEFWLRGLKDGLRREAASLTA